MQRQSMTAYGAPLEPTEIATPAPEGTQILLRIHHCGVCHSDLHIHDGHFNLGGGKQLDITEGRPLPFTLGHEIEGVVEAIGPDVEGIKISDRRVVYPWMGCGTCDLCLAGEEHLCQIAHHLGIYVDGGYASHLLVPHSRYLFHYDGIAPELAGSFMCSGLTAYGALKKAGPFLPHDKVMLIGLGGVGMMALQFAKELVPNPVLVAEIDPAKRDAALKAGAVEAFDPTDKDARKQVLKATGGVAATIDFAGTDASLKFASGIVRKGGRVVVAGLMGGELTMPIAMFALRPLSILGAFVGSLQQAREVLDLAGSGKIAPIPCEVKPLAQANEAIEQLKAGKVTGRLVLKI